MKRRPKYPNDYKTPLQPAPREWITQAEMVRRIEWFRARQEPLTLPLGRLGAVAPQRRSA